MWRKAFDGLIFLAALTLALPRVGHAYVDPGTGTILWQMAAASMIGSLFYLKKLSSWIRAHFEVRSSRAIGFAFATFFALVAVPLTTTVFHAHAVPRFNDLFLVGIVLTAYLFTWDAAVYLLLIATLVSAWVLPPYGSIRVEGFAEWYRLCSFIAISIFLICLISRMKTRRGSVKAKEPSFAIQVAAGAD